MIAAIFTKEADIDAGVNFAISSSLLLARVNQSPKSLMPSKPIVYAIVLNMWVYFIV